jgi:hypothetical protein
MSDETSCSSSAIAAPQDGVIASRALPGPSGLRLLFLAGRGGDAAVGRATCKFGGDEVKYRKSLEL